MGLLKKLKKSTGSLLKQVQKGGNTLLKKSAPVLKGLGQGLNVVGDIASVVPGIGKVAQGALKVGGRTMQTLGNVGTQMNRRDDKMEARRLMQDKYANPLK